MYRKTSTRPAFEEELPSDEDMIQKSLDGSRHTSNLSRRRSRFGEGDEGIAARLSKSRLTDHNEFTPTNKKAESPEFQEESPEAEYQPAQDQESPELDQGEQFEVDEPPKTTDDFGPDAADTRYFGFTKNGLKHGMGLLVHRDFEYEGQFKDDQYCGLGRLRTLDFEYEGAFENSMPQGAGLLVKDTGIYKGKFEGGFDPEGLGEIQIPGGAVYRGMISAARLHGFGTLTDSKGKTYTGYWKDGLKEGPGREKTKAGEYVGGWSKGKRHGAGTYTAADWKYEGDWRNGKREGVGLYKEGPITYLGTFEADLRNGLGKLIDNRSKTSYYGGFLHDMKQGIGFLVISNDESFFGEWNEDKRHGVGVLVRGKVETKGTWVDDDLHGYAYVTQPGKPSKVEVYSRGRLVQNPARKPTKEDIDELLAQVSETLPPTFFSIVSTKLNSLVVKEPVMYKLSVVRETENSLKEIDAAVDNSRMACQKDRKDLQTWLLKRGVNTSLDPSKTWDLEEIQQRRSKRESDAELKSMYESQADDGDRQNQTTQNASRINTSRAGTKKNARNPNKTDSIRKIDEEEEEPDAAPVIIRTARRNGRMDNAEEVDEMVRRKARPDETRKQAITKREQEARIAEVEADFQKYLKEKDAGNVPEVDSDGESKKVGDEQPGQNNPDGGLGIGRKYQSSTQNFDEPDFNTEEFSAYRQNSPKGASKDRLSNMGKQEPLNDSISRGNTDIRKTSLDVPGGDDPKDPQGDQSSYQRDSSAQIDKSSMVDIQSGRNDLSRSGKSRKVYSVPKSDFDIDNNDAGAADETKNMIDPSTAKFDESHTSKVIEESENPQHGYDSILTDHKKADIKIEDGFEPPANTKNPNKNLADVQDRPIDSLAEPPIGSRNTVDQQGQIQQAIKSDSTELDPHQTDEPQANVSAPDSTNPRKSSRESNKPDQEVANTTENIVESSPIRIQKEDATVDQPHKTGNIDDDPTKNSQTDAKRLPQEIPSTSVTKDEDLLSKKSDTQMTGLNPENEQAESKPPEKPKVANPELPTTPVAKAVTTDESTTNPDLKPEETKVLPPPPLPTLTDANATEDPKTVEAADVFKQSHEQPKQPLPAEDPAPKAQDITPTQPTSDPLPLASAEDASQTSAAKDVPAESPRTEGSSVPLPPPLILLPASPETPAPPVVLSPSTESPVPVVVSALEPSTVPNTAEQREPVDRPTDTTAAATNNITVDGPQTQVTGLTSSDRANTDTAAKTEAAAATDGPQQPQQQTERQQQPVEPAPARADDESQATQPPAGVGQEKQDADSQQLAKAEDKQDEKKDDQKKDEDKKEEEKKDEKKKEEEKKDWRSKLPGSLDELKSQGASGLFNTGKSMFGF